ncbi:MgtC/SapB family protein [Paenibacillus oenotherae]|uniref:MgtC/SapB family protein n=1 Tax=Paenibacillus oenotherae TaxID=1435645 RepID=A0ABS7D8Z7_9BACL|nr:MgtC/SapB family protein [Paenibacillus oenotherae]MBW7476403.1 MgtC/SapB family protein [Paenibacillus oenotherae]
MLTLSISNPWFIDELHIFIRLMLAVCLGGLIGFEREQSNHAAGLRTNILVCLGSCLLMMLSIYGFSDFVDEPNVRVDPARLAAAVITGIGFLGAGTILFTGKSITGLTTAASLWVVSAIGLAAGSGFYFASVTSTVLVLLILWALNKIERKYVKGKKQYLFKIESDDRSVLVRAINSMLIERGVRMREVAVQEFVDHNRGKQVTLQVFVTLPKSEAVLALIEDIRALEGVHAVSAE